MRRGCISVGDICCDNCRGLCGTDICPVGRSRCISVGDICCDKCEKPDKDKPIKHPKQYLVMDEEDVRPDDDLLRKLQRDRPERYAQIKGRHSPVRLCGDCALGKGYASRLCPNCPLKKGCVSYNECERPERNLTFFEKRAEV